MIEQLCRQYTDLKDKDIMQIEKTAELLPYFCELTNADIFIDCFFAKEEKGLVIAHGRPKNNSQYENNIAGEIVMPENEPIVFYTRKTGKSIQDAKGFTQEKKWVLQRTVPMYNDERMIIGVLIEERDMTNNVKANQKLKQLEENTEKMSRVFSGLDQSSQEAFPQKTGERKCNVVEKSVMIQEMHHRIKNNLQIIASILSMQERRSSCDETKIVLTDNINRINNIALIHESLMTNDEQSLNLKEQLNFLASSMMNYANGVDKEIMIQVKGDILHVDSERALSILMIVNELVTNSIRHGYHEKSKGNIDISLIKGTVFSTIIVEDNGMGFPADTLKHDSRKKGLGSEIIRMMVYDKLKGNFHINCEESGVCAQFDFRTG